MAGTQAKIGLGIVGLGGATVNMLPSFRRNPNLEIVGVADKDPKILERFKQDYPSVTTHLDIEKLCADPKVELIYIGTPNHLHAQHTGIALDRKKHVLIEKPMAVSLEEADEMIARAERNGVLLGVNVKHSFEARIQRIREFAQNGELGKLRMIQNWRFVDWIIRPRSPEEITPGWGTGILWRQGPHQFDVIRTIGGGLMRSVRGMLSTFDPKRRVPGSFTVYFEFEDDVCGTAVHNSYDHLESRILVHGFDTESPLSAPERYARARKEMMGHKDDPMWEQNAAASERYGGGRRSTTPGGASPKKQSGYNSDGWIMGGPLIASFDEGDVRLSYKGVIVDGTDRQWEIETPTGKDGQDGRDARLNSFCASIRTGKPLPADGRWGKATQEVLVAVDESAATRKEVMLKHQVRAVDSWLPA
jgi:phthalate 4,5-cis-dihydrodiol dehydrogenase